MTGDWMIGCTGGCQRVPKMVFGGPTRTFQGCHVANVSIWHLRGRLSEGSQIWFSVAILEACKGAMWQILTHETWEGGCQRVANIVFGRPTRNLQGCHVANPYIWCLGGLDVNVDLGRPTRNLQGCQIASPYIWCVGCLDVNVDFGRSTSSLQGCHVANPQLWSLGGLNVNVDFGSHIRSLQGRHEVNPYIWNLVSLGCLSVSDA